MVYIDDCILMSPDKKEVDKVIRDLKQAEANFTVDDLGDVDDYLGVKVEPRPNGKLKLSQPQLIASILKDLHLQSNTKGQKTPALQTLLHKDPDGPDMTKEFHYRCVIGKLNFLEKSTRPDISFIVHQCARFSEHPKEGHAQAIKRIGRYLKETAQKGYYMQPDVSKSFECWVDADFAGNWYPPHAANDPMTSKSRSGWVITYAGCPITWASKIQTLTALSTTEAEYIALSTALREVIPLMELAKEAKQQGVDIALNPPKVHCKVFEDNSGALEMAKLPKYRPRTKHLNNYYHHFRAHLSELTLVATSTCRLAHQTTAGCCFSSLSATDSRMMTFHYIHGRECDNIGTIACTAVT